MRKRLLILLQANHKTYLKYQTLFNIFYFSGNWFSLKPNIKIVAESIELLGVKVYRVDDDESLPFGDETFDLIINRHKSYCERKLIEEI